MTEERKKELAEETIIKIFPGVTKEHPMTTIGFMQLIDIVAAEAREEGIEEVLQFFEEGEEDTMWRPYEITDAIERLKEKGK